MVLLFVPIVAFARSDYVLFGLTAPFYALAAARVAMVLFTITAIVFQHRVTTVRVRDGFVLGWSVFMAVLALGISASRPAEYVLGIPVEVANITVFFFLIQNPLRFQLVPAFIFSTGALAILFALKSGVTNMGYFAVIIAYLVTNALGILVAWRLHYYRRLQFFAARELKAALANVKTLSGMIPICASCKKVRDDEGFWQGVEKYVMDHSDAQFSHGYCPACFELAMAEVDALKASKTADAKR